MTPGLRNFLISALLAAAAAATWLARPVEETAGSGEATPPAERGFYLLDAVFSGLDENGEVVYRLAAARIEGSEAQERMQFHDVAIQYRQAQESPWHISAAWAQHQMDGETLELEDVVIESRPQAAQDATRIEAATLELEPEAQLASTAGPVTLLMGRDRIDAVGLRADLRNEQITLESNIRGRVAR